MSQLFNLLDIQMAYRANGGSLTNEQLYTVLASANGISPDIFKKTTPIGRSRQPHNLIKRKVRWYQQTLKRLGIIKRTGKGLWQLAIQENGLHIIPENLALVAFSTKLGIALWSNASILKKLNEPIHLCLTSPPYPLKVKRQYGNPAEREWTDFICGTLEPIVQNLVQGGSIVLNVTNDVFEHKSPARSLYLERLILALHDNLGLYLMDRIPWINESKPPAPTYWACVKKYQLAVSWEPILWFTNCPEKIRSDNRRVLSEHSVKHKQLMENGGEQRIASYGDGAYKIRPGVSFSKITSGKIPKNIFKNGHNCKDTRAIRKAAKEMELPPHPAMFPTALPEFFIRFLTSENDLVVDPYAGAFKTCLAAEKLSRRWVGTERILEYVLQSSTLFSKN